MSCLGAVMEPNQLKIILTEHKIEQHLIQSIVDKATALTINVPDAFESILETPVEFNDRNQEQTIIVPPEFDDEDSHDTQIPLTTPDRLGAYDDLGVLGSGGMGSVRLVRDRKLNRRLAMKIIHPKLLAHKSAPARFMEEAQVCAQLQHPNIVPVHDFGTLPDGRLYFTMKEIKGRSLGSIIDSVHEAVKDGRFYPTEDGWTFRGLINAFHQVCQAISYAHSKGVLHRDLKPDNIMLGEFGEVLVVDWGIAKVVGRAHSLTDTEDFDFVSSSRTGAQATRMGQVAGTPAYMAPEQARGEIDKLNAQTDVYALGAILYEILTGESPYYGSSQEDVLNQVKYGPPPSLSTQIATQTHHAKPFFNATQPLSGLQIPEELAEACEVAMSRLQCDRYESAEKLGDVLLSWLDGAKKREKALAIVKETEQLSVRCTSLQAESKALLAAVATDLKDIPKWAGEEVKGPHWAKEREGMTKHREGLRLEIDIEHRLQSALSHKSDLEEGHEALAQRYLNAHHAAEIKRDDEAVDQNELRLRYHALALPESNPLRHRVLHYLKGTGAVSLITDTDNVDIYLEEYVEKHRRLIPKRIAHLGHQGLQEYPIEMGSYRLLLKKEGHHDVIYPIYIGRGEHWDGRAEDGVQHAVHLPKIGALTAEECFVPAGWFWCGGDPDTLGSYRRRRMWVPDFVISRFQVTNREYLVFLNGLLDQGREEEALNWVPRERSGRAGELGAMIYGRDEKGQFILVSDADGDMWGLDWPVCMVSWPGANAYCQWLSDREGQSYRLPTDLEWEKAARGVDERWFVWGDGFDPSYCHMIDSHQGRRLPVDVDSYPIDTSVYGVRGLAGNMCDWTSSYWRGDWGEPNNTSRRVYRGGSWNRNESGARVAYRSGNNPTATRGNLGFRLVRALFSISN